MNPIEKSFMLFFWIFAGCLSLYFICKAFYEFFMCFKILRDIHAFERRYRKEIKK